jgi:uncharacterized membrane protein YtjA (UPF0391 family)
MSQIPPPIKASPINSISHSTVSLSNTEPGRVIAELQIHPGVAGTAMQGAKIIFWIAVVLFVISLVFGFMRRGPYPALSSMDTSVFSRCLARCARSVS